MIENKDFWISYNSANENWATWIAWVLEQAGFSVVIQAWDFRPGSNFVLEMQQAARSAKRTIAVLSPAYLNARYPQPEWAAAFAKDPEGENKSLIPVVVERCDAEGLLSQVVHINLVGLDAIAAQKKLLAGLQPGRAKPLAPPSFPRDTISSSTQAKKELALPSVQWFPLETKLPVTWRSDLREIRREGGATVLELHLIPVDRQHLEVRKLDSLQAELSRLGRAGGLFSSAEGLRSSAGADSVFCQTDGARVGSGSGLLVTRSGQRGAWFTLPRDSLGSVFDPVDVQPRLESLLSLLLDIPIPTSTKYSFALRLAPCMLLSIGSASVIGVRRSTTMPFTSRPDAISVLPGDAVTVEALGGNLSDVAEELLARMKAELGK